MKLDLCKLEDGAKMMHSDSRAGGKRHCYRLGYARLPLQWAWWEYIKAQEPPADLFPRSNIQEMFWIYYLGDDGSTDKPGENL